MIIVSDTSVITNLINVDSLFLLKKLYQNVIIPQAVYQELSVLGGNILDQLEQEWIDVYSVENQADIDNFQKSARLDRGESEAILLAQQLNADLLLIDERRGRAEAQRRGIRITGLLGILVDAKTNELIAAVKPVMDKLMADATFRVSPALYALILKMAQEEDM